MTRYVQINSVPNGSTGSVMFQIHRERLARGDESWCLWGRGRAAVDDCEFNYGSRLGLYLDVLQTRLDDRAGFHSIAATRRLLAKLDEIAPDTVHMHNLHGYHANIEMLFDWLSRHEGVCVNWTLHDCWAFTGHCAFFTSAGCEQWRAGCGIATGNAKGDSAFHSSTCPQKDTYPKSVLADNSKRNYQDKRRIFTSLPADRLTIITPSHWLADLAAQSFLSKYPVEVHPNGVDRTVFKATPSDFRQRYGIGNRIMILGVASPWTERKGLGDFLHLRAQLDDRFAIVLVGLTPRQIKSLPNGILGLPRIDDAAALAEIYTTADILFNPTGDDTFPSVNLEAEACGTLVITYDSGGAAETLSDPRSRICAGFENALRCILDADGQRTTEQNASTRFSEGA